MAKIICFYAATLVCYAFAATNDPGSRSKESCIAGDAANLLQSKVEFQASTKKHQQPSVVCTFGRNDEMECCDSSGEFTDINGDVQECCIGSAATCAGFWSPAPVPLPPSPLPANLLQSGAKLQASAKKHQQASVVCTFGRNDEMECCDSSGEFTDINGDVQECCTGSATTCAGFWFPAPVPLPPSPLPANLLQSGAKLQASTKKHQPSVVCTFGRNDEMECCDSSGEFTDINGDVQECCTGSATTCAGFWSPAPVPLPPSPLPANLLQPGAKLQASAKKHQQPSVVCTFGRNDEMECCDSSGEFTDINGDVQECCIGSAATCAGFWSPAPVPLPPSPLPR